MQDDFEATFVVELTPDAVWEALTERTVEGEEPGEVHYVLAGFPSLVPLGVAGARCTPLEVEPGRLLRVRKDHAPCQGTEIAVRLEQAESGLRNSYEIDWLKYRLRDTDERLGALEAA